MIKILKQLKYIFNRKQKLGLFFLMVAIGIGTFLELIGVTAILPFINVVMNQDNIQKTWYLKLAYDFLGFQSTSNFIVFLAIVLIVVYIIKNVYLCILYNMQYHFTFSNQRKLAYRILDCYLRQPYIFHLKNNSADLIRNVSYDTNLMFQGVLAILQLVTEACVCIVLGIYLFIMDKTITVGVFTIMALFLLFFARGFKRYLNRIGNEDRKYSAEITKWIQQSFGGMKELKILEREQYFLNNFDDNYKKFAKCERRYRFLQVAPRPIMEAVCVVALLSVVAFKILRGTQSAYFISTLAVFAIAAFRLLPSVNRIANYMSIIMFDKPAIESVYENLKEIDKLQGKIGRKEDEDKIEFSKEIKIENLSFRYPDGEKDVLNNINFIIPKNKSVAFIGPSGGGKTTLADIILGVLNPSDGKILADNIDIHSRTSEWHKKIGYIPQTIYLMDDTIKNNITFGIPEENIDESRLWKAVEEAQMKDFVGNLPNGLDTEIGESGVRLSGGQRQRIGIARALYNNPEILVLDEATSALDNETESAVMQAIDNFAGTKTLIIIAHRLSTIKNCDIIYEVKDGKVKEVSLDGK